MHNVRIGLVAVVVRVAHVAEVCKLCGWCKQSLLMLQFGNYSLVLRHMKIV